MKTALITGASGDIGRALSLAFAGAGYAVALQYWENREAAEATAASITSSGGMTEIFRADLRREEEVEQLFQRAEERLGEMSLLVNNAGVSWHGLLTDMSVRDWEQVLGVNLTGAFLCCRRALPGMVRAHRGCILNISSMWGEVGASCEAAYSAAKAGLIGLTKALAKEVGPAGVRVNAITPGVIDTKMNAQLSPQDLAALAEETPLGCIGKPEDVAKAALFLAGQEFITGQVLGVSGGFVI